MDYTNNPIDFKKQLDIVRKRLPNLKTLKTQTLQELIFSVNLDDLKLRDREEMFVRSLPFFGFRILEAGKSVYGAKKVNFQRFRSNPRLKEAIRRVREVATLYIESISGWSFEKSLNLAQENYSLCEREIVRLNDHIAPTLQKIEERGYLLDGEQEKIDQISAERRRWMQTALQWKENMDKMHGYLTERKEIRSTIVYKEINDFVKQLSTEEQTLLLDSDVSDFIIPEPQKTEVINE